MSQSEDFVTCPICGYTKKRLYRHIKNVHGLTLDEFHERYPDCETTCSSLRQQIKSNTVKSKNTPESIQRRREFRNSEAGRKMAAENGRKVWDTPGFAEKLKENNSRVMKELWKNPEFREAQSERISESLNCERIHQLHHDRLVEQWKDPEYRRHITEVVTDMVVNGDLGARKEYIDNRGVKRVFRSSWELEVHNILNDLNIEHEYEKHRFSYRLDGESKVYLPDFFLPEYHMFLEVKPECFQNYEINLMKLETVRKEGYRIEYVGDNEYDKPDEVLRLIEG